MRRPAPPKAFQPPADRPPAFLIVRLSALGDVIHALPVLVALRARFPDAAIDWAVEDRFVNLVTARPEVDRAVVLPRRALRGGRPRDVAPAVRAFVGALRRRPYDAVLDLQGNLKSGIVTRFARARVRFGLDRRVAREGNHLFTNRRVLPSRGAVHRVARNLDLVSRFLGEAIRWTDPGLATTPGKREQALAALARAEAPPEGYVALVPGTSRFGAFKRWPPDRFRDLALRLAEEGTPVVVVAPPGEETLAAAVGAGAPGVSIVPVDGLEVLAEVLRRAGRVVAADTGPLHLAALAGTPLLGLYGPKDPAVYGPWGARPDGRAGVLDIHVRRDVTCRPCRLRRCADPVCMTGMDPDAVRVALAATRPEAAARG